jgi:hypothetical protein
LTAQGELFFDSQGNVLAQWNSHLGGGGLGLAEGWVRDLQCGLYDASIPYLWVGRRQETVRIRQAQEARRDDNLAPRRGREPRSDGL